MASDAVTARLTYTVDTGEKPVNESYGRAIFISAPRERMSTNSYG